MKAAYFTLGCKLNFAETSAIGRALAEQGVERIREGETPAIVVVNTCSVTAMADKKCRQLIARLNRQWPQAAIVVTGCYAQLQPQVVAQMPGVSIVLGSGQKLKAVQYVQQWLRSGTIPSGTSVEVEKVREMQSFEHSCERGDRTRWFLKVQDGCDCFCTYCTIPLARGRSRSPQIPELIEQAERAARAGAKEIILTGVNIGDFGKGRSDSFFDLARALDDVEGIERYRISSIEPDLLSVQLIEWVAKESRAFMPHFHIPLQSGSDTVLRLMARRYDTALFADRIDAIKTLMPHAFIGVDVIAGARGETQGEWEKSLHFINSLPLTRLHVFPYSERPGTSALRLDSEVVDQSEKHRRVEVLTEISNRKITEFMQAHIGVSRPVLWESTRKGVTSGLTDNYIRVCIPQCDRLHNTITNVTLLEPDGETMHGTLN